MRTLNSGSVRFFAVTGDAPQSIAISGDCSIGIQGYFDGPVSISAVDPLGQVLPLAVGSHPVLSIRLVGFVEVVLQGNTYGGIVTEYANHAPVVDSTPVSVSVRPAVDPVQLAIRRQVEAYLRARGLVIDLGDEADLPEDDDNLFFESGDDLEFDDPFPDPDPEPAAPAPAEPSSPGDGA